ncbi:putative DNA-directed DNA polymerase [Parafrankia sp. Ea1.12]|uniref:3'-5' exonuclease n=1 Tax=Parafrankia sp. Ea1.12 TaxID=573499 RepID=UPI000DA4DC46|nr:3'-5' exonuclease [Parafrankia sp. Ea1.12]SQD99561.1 putative DNA-directed DNA polymerase [Parafrankia sp. Ea1.12]
MVGSWQDAALVAVDLEGSGAQDRGREAILEIATIPLTAGVVQVAEGYHTMINPGRSIPRRPWISPGLTNDALSGAPALSSVEPELSARLNSRILVGHNIAVDWRLLQRRCPTLRPTGLIDTLRLARQLDTERAGLSLTALLDRHTLTRRVSELAPGGQPHRALWDAVGAGLLLACLAEQIHGARPVSLRELQRLAAIPLATLTPIRPGGEQTELFPRATADGSPQVRLRRPPRPSRNSHAWR